MITNYCIQHLLREAKRVMSKGINPYNKVMKQNVPPYIKYKVESSYGIWNWIVDGLTNYFNFNGRARRKAFWYFSLANITFLMTAKFAQAAHIMPSELTGLVEIISLALIIPMASVTVRRLHDVGRSGFMQLIVLIPILGLFILIYFLCQDTAPETNQWGLPAKQAL